MTDEHPRPHEHEDEPGTITTTSTAMDNATDITPGSGAWVGAGSQPHRRPRWMRRCRWSCGSCRRSRAGSRSGLRVRPRRPRGNPTLCLRLPAPWGGTLSTSTSPRDRRAWPRGPPTRRGSSEPDRRSRAPGRHGSSLEWCTAVRIGGHGSRVGPCEPMPAGCRVTPYQGQRLPG